MLFVNEIAATPQELTDLRNLLQFVRKREFKKPIQTPCGLSQCHVDCEAPVYEVNLGITGANNFRNLFVFSFSRETLKNLNEPVRTFVRFFEVPDMKGNLAAPSTSGRRNFYSVKVSD
jgi:hypothetical protein